ncbi:glucan biosynthesis protein G [Leptospira perolatii]|uniref:Glucans biosynthesis protein G n=1 Tax=Leptospira perolatii TaxID=2023191 RepID=A0A2M9ZK11_9LEPT|nr:glucan biosynthesis protein [Leptospira perolatii]PJZ69238.1 glucan biosynthesis protein G [Leptospira perolatii]PJZ72380.1 glucan biosynthesis protein G [Leptospira perolatii]
MLRLHIVLAFFATALLFAVADRQQRKEIEESDFSHEDLVLQANGIAPSTLPPTFKFSFSNLKNKARFLAKQTYKPPKLSTTDFLQGLPWNKYKEIVFRPEKSVWKKEGNPFQIQFFHPGHLYNTNVRIFEVRGDFAREIVYDPSSFDLSRLKGVGELPPNLGYSGFKIHYPINTQEHTDEFAVFQGASYFRINSKKQWYGLSARGIAINTGMNYPEDFPSFREFYLVKPDRTDSTIFIYALLDGKTVTGAYEFEITPGKISSVKVNAEIILRTKVDKVGIAPLTSMFWYSETRGIPKGQAYPESHDSDGLLIHTGKDEWVWRPLDNPKRTAVHSFHDEGLKGFGLIQRDRDFQSYQDSEMKYHLRPSAWVEPEAGWGKGSVQLLQNPTIQDSDDNIGAFWVPENLPEPGSPFEFSYTVRWPDIDPLPESLAKVVATRIGESQGDPDLKVFHVDFKGDSLNSLDEFAYLQAKIQTGENAELVDYSVQKIEETGVWRLTFRVLTKNVLRPAELKAALAINQETISENWTFTLEPNY